MFYPLGENSEKPLGGWRPPPPPLLVRPRVVLSRSKLWDGKIAQAPYLQIATLGCLNYTMNVTKVYFCDSLIEESVSKVLYGWTLNTLLCAFVT